MTTHKSKLLIILITLIMPFTTGCGLISNITGNKSSHEGHSNHSEKQKEATIYQCPMHPHYTSDQPGECPICGMRLVKANIQPEDHSQHSEKGVYINANKQQFIGIKTFKVSKRPVVKEIKTLGTVVPDERLITHVHIRFSGYVEEVFADYEGKYVSKGDPLFTIYSPDLVSTQEEYLLALAAEERLAGNKYDEIDKSQRSLKEATLRRLELWEISKQEIEELERTRKIKQHLTIHAPSNGFLGKKTVFEGLTITPNTDLYQITDLSRVWVIAEVFEPDLPYIKVGQNAKVTFSSGAASQIDGTITYVYPDLDITNRTGRVRIEVNNFDLKLKPNMYVDAILKEELGTQLIVPQTAIVDTGERKIIFAKTEDEYFRPINVELGAEVNLEDGNYQVIKSGLSEGEEIVTDGTFLLDSESNLQSALKQLSGGHNH